MKNIIFPNIMALERKLKNLLIYTLQYNELKLNNKDPYKMNDFLKVCNTINVINNILKNSKDDYEDINQKIILNSTMGQFNRINKVLIKPLLD